MTEPWGDLSERVVMVARYAEQDGIGRYADQLIQAHSEGRTFLRVGIPDGPGDYHRTFHRGPRALWLLRDAGRRDDVVVNYHPHYYVSGGGTSRFLSYISWGVLGLLRRVTLVSHEPDPPSAPALEEAARRWAWRRARRIVFHSTFDRERHLARFGAPSGQEHLVVQLEDFDPGAVTADRAEARATLGLASDRTVLVMIGFISASDPDKAYDRAIAAVQAADEASVDLHIVGSPIRDAPDLSRLLDQLRRAAEMSSQIHLHEGFVDDPTFDLWVRAADAVLTPYRTASSSAVFARARLLGTPVITSDAGGLAEQAGPYDVVVRNDDELVAAVRRIASARRSMR